MKRILIVIIMVLILTSCRAEIIKIGVLGDYKGNGSTHAKIAYNSLVIANEKFEDIDFIFESIQVDEDIENLSKILEEGQYDFIIGPFLSSELEISYETLVASSIVTFIPTATATYIAAKDDNVVRLTNSTHGQSKKMTEIINKAEKGNLLILYDFINSSYTTEFKDVITQYAEMDTIESRILTDTLTYDKLSCPVDFYDVIVIITPPKRAGILIQKLRKDQFDSMIYLSPWSSGHELLEYIGTDEKDVKIVFNNYSRKTEAFKFYQNEYIDRFGIVPNSAGLMSYETLYFIKTMGEEIDLKNKNQVIKYISQSRDYEGVFYDSKLDNKGNGEIEMHVVTIKDGIFVYE